MRHLSLFETNYTAGGQASNVIFIGVTIVASSVSLAWAFTYYMTNYCGWRPTIIDNRYFQYLWNCE